MRLKDIKNYAKSQDTGYWVLEKRPATWRNWVWNIFPESCSESQKKAKEIVLA